MPKPGTEDQSSRIAIENRAPGSDQWRAGTGGFRAADDATGQIKAYASATSVDAGSTIAFHVSTAIAEPYTIGVFRLGHYDGAGARSVLDGPALTGSPQPGPAVEESTGLARCDWPVAWTLQAPESWISGLYVAVFSTASKWRTGVPFVVREPHRTAALCVILPFTTYQAHNQWPMDGSTGKGLHHGYEPTTVAADGTKSGGRRLYTHRATAVSFDRPYAKDGLPEQFQSDLDFIAWAEQGGYDLTYATSVDLHAGRIDPARHAGLVFSGQDEYWSKPMRATTSLAVARGTHLAFLAAGNAYWHARLDAAPDGRPDRTLTCYKSDPDPLAETDVATTSWRTRRPGPGAPEQALIGIQFRANPPKPVPLTVAGADHWLWAGTGVADGDTIDNLVGGKADDLDPKFAGPTNMTRTLLAASPYQLANGTGYTQATSVVETRTGALVFASGTSHWPLGLNRDGFRDARVRAATHNLLTRMVMTPTWRAPITAIMRENLEIGTRMWRPGADGTTVADDSRMQIKGYASATSVDLGGTIDFHVSVNPEDDFTIAVHRIGFYGGENARYLMTSPVLHAKPQPAPVTDAATGMITCDWAPVWTLTVPAGWTSGYYMAVFTSASGWRSCAPFVVRDPARRGGLCIIVGFTTYQAYNQFPLDGATGKNLYYGINANGANDFELRARVVSFDRPYMLSGIPSRFEFDVDFIRWVEQVGYDVTYATSIDLHAGTIDPDRYAGLLFIGHDEYWSRPMREHATRAFEAGTALAYFEANNVYWHIRVEDAPDGRPYRTIACYKSDPDPHPDERMRTFQWREFPPEWDDAEQGLLGVQFNGIPAQPLPLVVRAAGHWFWAGTGVRDGDEIAGVVGGEADGYDIRYPGPVGYVPTMLSHSPYEYPPGTPLIQNSSIYQTDTGAIMFASSTNDWPAALIRDGRRDDRIQRATANLLDRMLGLDPAERAALAVDTPAVEAVETDRGGLLRRLRGRFSS